MMITRRRLVLAVTLGAPTAPFASLAQQQERKIPRIGILLLFPVSARRQNWDAFLAALRDLGYIDGQNISIEFVSADGHPGQILDPEQCASDAGAGCCRRAHLDNASGGAEDNWRADRGRPLLRCSRRRAVKARRLSKTTTYLQV